MNYLWIVAAYLAFLVAISIRKSRQRRETRLTARLESRQAKRLGAFSRIAHGHGIEARA